MQEGQLDFTPRYLFHAYHLTDTLRLKDINRLFGGTAKTQSATKLVYQEDAESYFFIFRFGSVIFFNIDPTRQTAIIERIKMLIGQKPDMLTSDEFAVEVKANEKCSVGFERATLDKLNIERIELLALILAQSTALEYFENRVEDLIRRTADIGQILQQRGRLVRSSRELKKFIGYCITTKRDIVSSLYILDKPDETWNDQLLDSLYREAAEMFELKDRYKTLDYKLKMTQENLGLISELLQYRNANFLEWAIIILIAFEIVLFVFQLFVLKV